MSLTVGETKYVESSLNKISDECAFPVTLLRAWFQVGHNLPKTIKLYINSKYSLLTELVEKI